MKNIAAITTLTLLLISLLASSGIAAQKRAVTPSTTDKCPVCGMFVARYPDWTAVAKTKDGMIIYFDGAKDMFTYYFNPGRYTPGKKQSDISGHSVTEYYSLKMIDAKSAFYVVGSDVFGPMGTELIAFATEKDAADFMKDHKGKRLLRFPEITPAVIKSMQ